MAQKGVIEQGRDFGGGGEGGAAILTGIEIEKKMNEMSRRG